MEPKYHMVLCKKGKIRRMYFYGSLKDLSNKYKGYENYATNIDLNIFKKHLLWLINDNLLDIKKGTLTKKDAINYFYCNMYYIRILNNLNNEI